jgi:hypothetical protein
MKEEYGTKAVGRSVAGVLDEPFSQLTLLSGVALQARQSTQAGTVSIICYVAWWAGMANPLNGLS